MLRNVRRRATVLVLLMMEFQHDLIYQNPKSYGSIVYMGSCRASLIDISMFFGLLMR